MYGKFFCGHLELYELKNFTSLYQFNILWKHSGEKFSLTKVMTQSAFHVKLAVLKRRILRTMQPVPVPQAVAGRLSMVFVVLDGC